MAGDLGYQDPFFFLGMLRRYSVRMRKRMFKVFLDEIKPALSNTILDVGVSTYADYKHVNMLEKEYPYPKKITMLGIEEGKSLESRYPGTTYVRYEKGKPIPFTDRSFDICYSLAVVEHVGSIENQRKFIQELLRVGRNLYLTSPNRWYPIEPHKLVPFLHWLPLKWYRKMLFLLGDAFLSKEENFNPISKRTLIKTFSEERVPFRIVHFRIFGLVANHIVIVKR